MSCFPQMKGEMKGADGVHRPKDVYDENVLFFF
jgi:hypothetical protein